MEEILEAIKRLEQYVRKEGNNMDMKVKFDEVIGQLEKDYTYNDVFGNKKSVFEYSSSFCFSISIKRL